MQLHKYVTTELNFSKKLMHTIEALEYEY